MIGGFVLRLACVGIVIWTSASAFAADNDASVQLTGGSSREWVYRRVVNMMGADDACKAGEAYTFSKDGTLTVRQCVNQHLLTMHHKWSVTSAENGDTILAIDEEPSYVLLFSSDRTGGHFMHLRTKNKRQTEPVVDKVFELNEE